MYRRQLCVVKKHITSPTVITNFTTISVQFVHIKYLLADNKDPHNFKITLKKINTDWPTEICLILMCAEETKGGDDEIQSAVSLLWRD